MAEHKQVVHKYRVDAATGHTMITEVVPIRTLIAKGRPTVNIRAGRFEYDDGTEIPRHLVEQYGLDPDMKNGAPTHMDPPPEVLKILGEAKEEALKEWAYDIKGGPRRSKKGR